MKTAERKIRTGRAQIDRPLPILGDFRVWLESQSPDLTTLLAHADDGVIWGRRGENGRLMLAGEVISEVVVRLRSETLQQARLFGNNGELLVWRTDAGLESRLIVDEGGEEIEFFDEPQVLWGTEIEKQVEGFTLLREGEQGFLHAPPLVPSRLPMLLYVRHYIAYDEAGQTYIKWSRLLRLDAAFKE